MAQLESIIEYVPPLGTAFQLIEPTRETAVAPAQQKDDTALRIVVQDVSYAEQFIQSKGLLAEWDRADKLNLFHVPVANWDGSSIPRAHLGVPLVVEHVESILPQIMTGLFSDNPPFASNPRPGTKMQTARAADAILAWFLKEIGFREELLLGSKSMLLYGTGVWKWGWETYERKRKQYQRKEPKKFVPTGIGGVNVNQPKSDEIEQVEITESVNRPTFEHINLRHILVDPGCRTQDVRKARWIAHRVYKTYDEVLQLAEYEGYELPDEPTLRQILFNPKEVTPSSELERTAITFERDFKAVPRAEQTSVDPTKQRLELLEYWTADRVYTVLNRKLIIRNEDNEYGVIPFCSVNFVHVLDCFFGMGIAKLVGDEQRMQQGVINTFLDDLSLNLNGMFVRKRGTNTPTQQMRMRPGGIIDSDDEKGVNILQRQPIDSAIFGVIAASDQRAQRRTAANELVVQGSLPAQGSSITRTATGVNALTGGSGARLQYLIENIAHLVFVPTLAAFHKMIARKMRPSELEYILSAELQHAYEGDVVDIMNARIDFDILAASKLSVRRSLGQAMPILYQFLLAEPVLESLQQQGKKVNVAELVNMLFDAIAAPNRQDIVVDMSQDDEARAAMNNPGVQQMLAQREQSATQQKDKLQVIEEENIARAGRDIIKEAIKSKEQPAVGQ